MTLKKLKLRHYLNYMVIGTVTAVLRDNRQLAEQMAKGAELDAVIRERLGALGYGV